MGSGCSSKSRAVERNCILPPQQLPATKEPFAVLQGRLAPVLHAAGKASSLSDAKVDDVIGVLAKVDSDDAGAYFAQWLSRAPAKSRTGLLQVMQRVVARSLDANVVVAEELIASEESGDTGEVRDFARLATACEDALRLDEAHSQAVRTAAMVVDGAAKAAGDALEEKSASYNMPVLDRLVLLFRGALVAHSGSAARMLQQWREFEDTIGLLHLEAHMALLGASAKALLLGVLLVPDGVPPTAVVVRRDYALLDAAAQLPKEHASLLLPYFESSSGTKVIQGRRVEGGEGHGPRKEFFAASSADALRRWGQAEVAPPSGSPAAAVGVLCQGSSIALGNSSLGEVAQEDAAGASEADGDLRRCLAQARVGDKLRLEFTDGTEAERVVTAVRTGREPSLIVGERFESGQSAPSVAGRCELQRPVLPLFEFHRGTGQNWFSAYASSLNSPKGEELRSRYRSFGKLIALAVANNCRISFALPVLFFRILLRRGGPPTLADLVGFDDALHSSLKKCLKMKQAQFASLKELEAMPPEMTREEYLAEQVKSMLAPEAMEEVQKGFWSLTPASLMDGVASSDMRQMVCPRDSHKRDIDIRRIFKVSMEEEMAECAPFVEAFWAVIDSLTLEEKRLFLLFLTGVEVPPEPGVERLTIELPFSAFSQQEHKAMLNMLPQAHTCTNTLELPNYHDALLESGAVREEQGPEVLAAELRRILGEKLRLAISESNGYELDAISEQDVVEQVSAAPTAATAAPSAVVSTPGESAPHPPPIVAATPPLPSRQSLSSRGPGTPGGADAPGRGSPSPAAYPTMFPSTAHAPSPGPRRGSSPLPLPEAFEARPALRLPAIVPRHKVMEIEEQAPVAEVRSPELVSKTKAPSPPMQTDVDSLLQDCGLLSLLSEEGHPPARSPSESPAKKVVNVGGQPFDLSEAVVVEDLDR